MFRLYRRRVMRALEGAGAFADEECTFLRIPHFEVKVGMEAEMWCEELGRKGECGGRS